MNSEIVTSQRDHDSPYLDAIEWILLERIPKFNYEPYARKIQMFF